MKKYYYFNADSKPDDGVMVYYSNSEDLTDVETEIENDFCLTDLSVFDCKSEATSELMIEETA